MMVFEENGIRIKSTSKQFKINNDHFDYGSLLVPVVKQSVSPGR